LFRLTGERSRSFEGHCLCQGHANMSSVGGFSKCYVVMTDLSYLN